MFKYLYVFCLLLCSNRKSMLYWDCSRTQRDCFLTHYKFNFICKLVKFEKKFNSNKKRKKIRAFYFFMETNNPSENGIKLEILRRFSDLCNLRAIHYNARWNAFITKRKTLFDSKSKNSNTFEFHASAYKNQFVNMSDNSSLLCRKNLFLENKSFKMNFLNTEKLLYKYFFNLY